MEIVPWIAEPLMTLAHRAALVRTRIHDFERSFCDDLRAVGRKLMDPFLNGKSGRLREQIPRDHCFSVKKAVTLLCSAEYAVLSSLNLDRK